MSDFLFVYGTLLPGGQAWQLLAPFVDGSGDVDSVPGTLCDTGLGYPAALLEPASAHLVWGRTVRLIESRQVEALRVLDEFEDVAADLYRRVLVTTTAGRTAWAYTSGVGLELAPIPSGDWLQHLADRHDESH